MAGSLVEIDPPLDNPHAGAGFKLEITEVALTYVGTPADHLVIESWHGTAVGSDEHGSEPAPPSRHPK